MARKRKPADDRVENAVMEWVKGEGGEPDDYVFLEVKVDPNVRDAKELRARRLQGLQVALGKIILEILTEPVRKYVTALPRAFRRLVRARLDREFCKLARLHILFVGPSGDVEAWTWRDLKAGQSAPDGGRQRPAHRHKRRR